MLNLNEVGIDWLLEETKELTDHIVHIKPTDFNEEHRYLPASVTPIPGFIRYDVNPYMREPLNCCDVNSPINEVYLKKGVQITFTTLLESMAFYYMVHIKTNPMMYVTADKELASARIENNFLPMLEQSGFSDIIRSSDEGNSRKTGKTKDFIQFEGGGYLVPLGANNPNKFRSFSIPFLLLDELDAWPDRIGKDSDPLALVKNRAASFWDRRKIFGGSTPLEFNTSKIEKAYARGDQRKYIVLCKKCSYPQELRWESINKETGIVGGFMWDFDSNDVLIEESVRYCCQNCGHEHFEHDKERLFSPDHGAHWKPTATPESKNIRSYHLPAFYSPRGMQPWAKCVTNYLEGYDPKTKKIVDIGKYRVFYNEVLAKGFKDQGGDRIKFIQASSHRRMNYKFGQIPNEYAKKHSGSPILFLTCAVDVHKKNLAVSVFGWTRDCRCYLIDYWRFEVEGKDPECPELTSPVWGRLREVIEEKQYIADDGKKYKIVLTFIDAGFSNDTVSKFCAQYAAGVYPTLGRDRPAKNQRISEFAEFKTQAGKRGYRILVDHYKDRLAPILRREWREESGEQGPYHFNAPVDVTKEQLQELTKEYRKDKTDERGFTTYYWHRPGSARNELWDLLVLGHASVDVLAWSICIQHFGLETIEWRRFWDYLETEKLYFEDNSEE